MIAKHPQFETLMQGIIDYRELNEEGAGYSLLPFLQLAAWLLAIGVALRLGKVTTKLRGEYPIRSG